MRDTSSPRLDRGWGTPSSLLRGRWEGGWLRSTRRGPRPPHPDTHTLRQWDSETESRGQVHHLEGQGGLRETYRRLLEVLQVERGAEDGEAGGGDGAGGAEQRPAAHPVDDQIGDERGGRVGRRHQRRRQTGVDGAGRAPEDALGVEDDGVDARRLLEEGQAKRHQQRPRVRRRPLRGALVVVGLQPSQLDVDVGAGAAQPLQRRPRLLAPTFSFHPMAIRTRWKTFQGI